MRRLTSIFSQRKTSFWPSFKIVYEWEDILSCELRIPIYSDNKWWKKFYRRFEVNGLTSLYHRFLPSGSLHIDFLMESRTEPSCRYNKKAVIAIIDFWLKEEELPSFYESYRHVPLLLATNREVYRFLKEHACPIPVEHWPLSYPDQYKFDESCVEKKVYDFCLFGRPNPFFVRLIQEYEKHHPDFVYLVTKGNESNREFYTNKGEFVCKDTGRASYLDMIRKTKITCYSTPGIDEGKKAPAPFNQVTPRLFEMLCNGCHVIGHYPESDDTNWYGLSSLIPNVNDYGEFEHQMDKMRREPVDTIRLKEFMQQHYTTTRAQMLKEVLQKHNIMIG